MLMVMACFWVLSKRLVGLVSVLSSRSVPSCEAPQKCLWLTQAFSFLGKLHFQVLTTTLLLSPQPGILIRKGWERLQDDQKDQN